MLHGDPSQACLSATGVYHNIPTNIPLCHQSDLLRCALLADAGGVWVDATCLCVTPLNNWVFDVISSGFFAFRDPGPDRLISNWLLASVPGCSLVRSFYMEHERYWNENQFPDQNTKVRLNIRSKLNTILNRNPTLAFFWLYWPVRRILRVYPYYIFHYHFAMHIAKNKSSHSIFEAMPYHSADAPHILQMLARHQDLSMTEIKSILLSSSSPVYKLTWKEEIFQREGVDMETFLNNVLGTTHC